MSGIWRLSSPCSGGWLKRCTSHRTWAAERDALQHWAPHMHPPGPPLLGAHWDGAQGWLWTGHVEGRNALEQVGRRVAQMGRAEEEPPFAAAMAMPVHGREPAGGDHLDLLRAQWRGLLRAVGEATASLHQQAVREEDALPLDVALHRRAARTLRALRVPMASQKCLAEWRGHADRLVGALQEVARSAAPSAEALPDPKPGGPAEQAAHGPQRRLLPEWAERDPVGGLPAEASIPETAQAREGFLHCLSRVTQPPEHTASARVPCHRDLQARNWLVDEALNLKAVIDFEHARPDDPLVDLLRLHDEVPLLCEQETLAQFLVGYGRDLKPSEGNRLEWLRAHHVLQGANWALRHRDTDFARRALRGAAQRALPPER